MGSAKVHSFLRPRSLASYADEDLSRAPADFRLQRSHGKYETVKPLPSLKEMDADRVRDCYDVAGKRSRSSTRSNSGSNCSDRELGEISSESGGEEPLDFHGEVTKPGKSSYKRKYSNYLENGVGKRSHMVVEEEKRKYSQHVVEDQVPRVLENNKGKYSGCGVEEPSARVLKDECEAGQIPEIPEFDSSEEPLRNIAASRWAAIEDCESPDTKIVEPSSNPRSKDYSHPSDSEGGSKGTKLSSNPSGGETLSPVHESIRQRSGGSGGSHLSSVCSDNDGGHRSGESCGRGEIGVFDDEYDQMDIDQDVDDEEDRARSDSHEASPSDSPSLSSPSTSPFPSPSPLPVLSSRRIDMLQGCRSVDEFERLNKISEGTYGIVYRARDKKTGEIVALKKVKMEREREGFPLSALREINVLLSLQHSSIVNVKEVVVGSSLDSIFMVMEYMEHDLKAFMEIMKQPFSLSEVKCLMLQLLEGMSYLHDNWILHRDLKTSNLLFNNKGELKICDFGLARQYGSPLKTYTQLVVTLWYRAPELLLGIKKYSTAIDMWSVGCIMAELLAKEPLFNGKSEIDQLDKMFKTLGTPNEKIWPDFVNLPGAKCKFVRQPYNKLREKFPAASFSGKPTLSESGFDLLNRLLTYDPDKRITAEEALNHPWFREVPLPKMKTLMPTCPSRSDRDRQSRKLLKTPALLGKQLGKVHEGELAIGGLFG
uniref:cyclin-dependent kinase n=1 Tax=Wollemia nobilis TaxID=56998 RepID=A0A0C9RYV4_9CONI